MRDWLHDLFSGALSGFAWIFGCRLLSLAFGADFFPGFFSFVAMTSFYTWQLRYARRQRIKQEIDDLMTALRISMTGK